MKVLIIFNKLQHYRIPILNILSSKVELTVKCKNADEFELCTLNFKLEKVELSQFGPFSYFSYSTWKKFDRFDVIIGLFSLRNISNFVTAINPFRPYKFIYWGIGVPASYTKRFDDSRLTRSLMMFMSFFSDALIFYSSYPLKYYRKIRPNDSLFVADNTIYFDETVSIKENKRNEFLFIGTLYKQKGLEDLINNYHSAYRITGDSLPSLNIVGDGELYDSLNEMVGTLGLSNKIYFSGAIYEARAIEECFSRAILCVSPRQAGLSVLTSMAYSVPFVTVKNAYTGGEIFNIVHNETGVLLEDENEIVDIFCDAACNKGRYESMGKNAKDFYRRNRSGDNMAEKIYEALCYVFK